MATIRVPTFVWIPPDRSNQNWSITINGEDMRDRVVSGKLSWGLLGEDLSCELQLENSDGELVGKFSENHIIVFKMDYEGGNTKQWEGEIESIPDDYNSNGSYNLKIIGSHYGVRTVDINVNKEYINTTISDIRKDLISTYMSGFTSNNVETNTKIISIKFIDKPLIDCMMDLNIQGDEDCFVDHDKDFHSFIKGSRINEDEALVIDDNMFDIKDIGIDNTTKRNKVTVYGEIGGLPIIHVSSTTQSRTREKIITDSSIVDESLAKELSDTELDKESNPDTDGGVAGLFTPNLIPGYMTYIISPPQVHDMYRISKYTFNIPDESMEIQISQRRTIAKLFKDRILKDIGQENINNPFTMTRSYVLSFDDTSKIDTGASSGYIMEDGVIRKDTSFSEATIFSLPKSSDIYATNMSLKVVGNIIDGATYSFIANNSAIYQSIYPDTDTSVTTIGKDIRLKIIITNDNTRIDTIGLYWR